MDRGSGKTLNLSTTPPKPDWYISDLLSLEQLGRLYILSPKLLIKSPFPLRSYSADDIRLGPFGFVPQASPEINRNCHIISLSFTLEPAPAAASFIDPDFVLGAKFYSLADSEGNGDNGPWNTLKGV